MYANYPECIKRLLRHEGGYTNHPADPGGPTNFGITIFDARKYWKPGATAEDVKAMPLAVAKDIYRTKYWGAQRCDDLPSGVEDSIFDYGVNSGIGRSGKVLRRVMGLPDSTSAVTPEVVAAVAKRDPKAVINAINDERLAFLKRLKTWPTFGAGWGRRVSEVRAYDLSLVGKPGTPASPPLVAPQTTAKGVVPKPDVNKKVVAGAGTGGGAAGLGFWDWIAANPKTSIVLAVLLVGGAVALAHWIADRWQKSQQEAPVPNTPVVPEMK